MPVKGEEGRLGDMGWPLASTPRRDKAEPPSGPHRPMPHSSTEKPHPFPWTHFSLTKSANY